MRRTAVRTVGFVVGLGVLVPGPLRGDPAAPFVDPPFGGACGAVRHFGEAEAPPLDGCAADPLCVEYEKRDITATNGGAVRFLAAEPARFAIAIPRCRYWQRDHWRVQVAPGDPAVVGWDGDYWFNKRNATGGAELNNFTIGGQPAGPGQVADLVGLVDPDLAATIRSYGTGPGGGGGSTFDVGVTDPSCGAPDACTDDLAVSRVRAAVDAQCGCGAAVRPGVYRRCVASVLAAEVGAGRLPAACRSGILACAARSTCGRGAAVTCYRTDARGRTSCSVRRSAAACRAPAVVGSTPFCCDPRTVAGCS